MRFLFRFLLSISTMAIGGGCTSHDPLFCDLDQQCTAGHAFCDVEGVCPASGGHGNTCIPAPCWDGGVQPDALATDATTDADASIDAASTDGSVPCDAKIVFQSQRESTGIGAQVFVMNPDGSGQTNVSGGKMVATFNGDAVWSHTGRIAYGCDFDICVVNPDGTGWQQLTHTAQGFESAPTWSPDGTQIAYQVSNNTGTVINIWVINADGSNPQQLTSSGADFTPQWSPDGLRIAFVSLRDGDYEIYVMNAAGNGVSNLTQNPAEDGLLDAPQWSPDSSKLLFVSDRNANLNYDVYVMNSTGGSATALSNQAGADQHPRWSADGSRIAWIHLDDVWVMNSDGSAQSAIVVSATDEAQVEWAGDKLIYRGWAGQGIGDEDLYSVNTDGTGMVRLTSASGGDHSAKYTGCIVP